MSNPTKPSPRVAFLGLGIMGGGMARRLLAAGFPLAVYNRTAAKARELAAGGANGVTIAESPRDAAAGAEFIISMLADDAASREVWLGDDGALEGAARGAVLIESSTVTTEWIRELSEAARAKGCELLDAPVTGSKAQAVAGELKFLVGGSDAAFERARPILADMSRSTVHVGPTGRGALLKLINNFMCGVQAASLAEALVLIERSGLDRVAATQVLAEGAPGSPMVKTLLARMMAQDYAPQFHAALMKKDLSYALKEAERCGVGLETARAALTDFERAVAKGRGQQDLSAVVEALRGD